MSIHLSGRQDEPKWETRQTCVSRRGHSDYRISLPLPSLWNPLSLIPLISLQVHLLLILLPTLFCQVPIFCLFIPLPSQTYCRLGKCQYLSQSIIIDTDKASLLQLTKHRCCNFFKASLLQLKMTTTMLYLFNNDALLYCQSIVIYKWRAPFHLHMNGWLGSKTWGRPYSASNSIMMLWLFQHWCF